MVGITSYLTKNYKRRLFFVNFFSLRCHVYFIVLVTCISQISLSLSQNIFEKQFKGGRLYYDQSVGGLVHRGEECVADSHYGGIRERGGSKEKPGIKHCLTGAPSVICFTQLGAMLKRFQCCFSSSSATSWRQDLNSQAFVGYHPCHRKI